MNVITSKENDMIKKIKKLKDKKYRDSMNQYLIEGIKLVEEAIEEKANIKLLVICEDCVQDGTISQKLLYKIAEYECIYVVKKVFQTLSDVSSPQGILGVIEKQNNSEIDYKQDIILALNGIQDPGNLGTILRTADSANLKQIIVSKDTVDAYSPKVVRSTMGAIFRVNIIQAEDLKEKIKEIKKHKFELITTSLDTKETIYDINYSKKIIVIGNEANGVSEEIQKIADKKVIIPMIGKTESLNASVATGIIIYEYVRQKHIKNNNKNE